jgi:Uma2 family endonuclease
MSASPYQDAHPARPALALEVAETSLEVDRGPKASLYARAEIQDYWILNLAEGVLEVYRDPQPDPSAAYGWRYRSVSRLAPPAAVAPLALPSARIPVADLLP